MDQWHGAYKQKDFISSKRHYDWLYRKMCCPTLKELPPPPTGKVGWPWTEESAQLPDSMSEGKHWPKISIVTPSYNQGQFIEESIRSVLLQGYPNLEYIIIDGGSTDATLDIIKKYEPWLAYWVSEPDRGQSHAINKGLKRSTGQLFNWHNSDDVLTPNSLATTAAAMVKHPKASYVHGYSIVIDNQSNVLYHNNNHPLLKNKTGFLLELAWSVSNLKCGGQPGCLMDRKLVVEVGMIDENLHYVMDLDIPLRLALVRPQFYVDYPVVYFRVHQGMKSTSWNKQHAKERLIVAHKLFSRKDLPPPIRKLRRKAFATAHQFACRVYAEAGMYHLALWHNLLDFFYSPGNLGARRAFLYKYLYTMPLRGWLFGFVKKRLKAYKNYYENRKHESKLFSKIKRKDKNYKEYLRCQLYRTLSKKERDDAYSRVKYLLSKLVEKVNYPNSNSKDVKILSVGCRNMYEVQAFHDMGFKNVTGIDLYSEDESIIVMDMQDMTFEDNSFDVIFSSHSLEHARDYKKAISEFVRVAKDGAIFVLEVPVNYETRGADLWDFESLENLKSLFQKHTSQILYEELEKKMENASSGTDVMRMIFTISKEGER